MDGEELADLVEEYWRFAKEYVFHRAREPWVTGKLEFGVLYEHIRSKFYYSVEFGVLEFTDTELFTTDPPSNRIVDLYGEAIALGLHAAGIDPAAFWEFHLLIWKDLAEYKDDETQSSGALTDSECETLLDAWRSAELPILLFRGGESEPLEPIEEDIIAVIEAAGCRLVTDEILAALVKACGEGKYGESTVKKWLAKMVSERKLINVKKGGNRGYGVALRKSRPSID